MHRLSASGVQRQGALDARAKLAGPAGKEDEERDEKRLSKADRTGSTDLISDFFNIIDPTATWAAQDFRTAKALFVLSLKRDIIPSVAWT